jgi:hypothetical protein
MSSGIAGVVGVALVLAAGAAVGGGWRSERVLSTVPPASGMNGFELSRLPLVEVNLQLAAMASHGVQVVRSDAPWGEIQPSPPRRHRPGWQFAATDRWVAALAVHHLAWEPIIDYAVGWAKRCRGFCAPLKNATYAAFSQALARRYGNGGTFWSAHPELPFEPAQSFEIWNEENVVTYRILPARYATLYAAARRAIHAVDPQATVLVGGLADDSQTFEPAQDYPAQYVAQMFRADPRLRGRVDGFALHPYGATATDVQDWVVDFRAALVSLGEGTAPIDVTEIGWPAAAGTDAWRASMMSQVADALSRSNCGIDLLAPYDWINPVGVGEAGDFGLVSQLGIYPLLRPAAVAWFKALGAARSLPTLDICR